MGSINPGPDQVKELIASVPPGVPVVMLNMVRFRQTAQYPDGRSAVSGQQAYGQYTRAASELVAKVGGAIVWFGRARASFIAPPGEKWDHVFLVRYPSIEKFMEMINSPAYQDIVVHRTSALQDSRLIATIEAGE